MRIIQSDNPRPLNLLAVGPDGLVAAASSTFGVPGNVEVWNAGTGQRVTTFPGRRELSSLVFDSLAFDPTAAHLLVAGESFGVSVVSASTGAALAELEEGTNPLLRPKLAAFPDGARLLVTSDAHEGGGVGCWRIAEDLTFHRLWIDRPTGSWFLALAVSPDGTRGVTAERSEWNDGRPRLDIVIRDAATGEVSAKIVLDPASPVQQLAFTTESTKLLVRTDSRTVQLFNIVIPAAAGELVHPGRPYVTGVAVHPRGPVACARTNGTVTFWDAEKGEQLRTLDWKSGRLVSVAFSPDGSLAAAGTEDGKIVVWDVDL
jgi:WD40 repeat protein